MKTRPGKQAQERTQSRKRDDPKQSKAFIEKAREIGADEDRSNADELIKKLAQKPPEPKRKQEH